MKTAKSFQMLDLDNNNLSPNVNIESIYYEEDVNGRINRRSIYKHFPVYINYNDDGAISENSLVISEEGKNIDSFIQYPGSDLPIYISAVKESPIPNTIYKRIDVSTYDLSDILKNYAPANYTVLMFSDLSTMLDRNSHLHIEDVIENDNILNLKISHETANYDSSTEVGEINGKSLNEIIVNMLFSNKTPEIILDASILSDIRDDAYIIDAVYLTLYGIVTVIDKPTYEVAISSSCDIHSSFKNAIIADNEDIKPYSRVFATLEGIDSEKEGYSTETTENDVLLDASLYLDSDNPVKEYTYKICLESPTLEVLKEVLKTGLLESVTENEIVSMYLNAGFIKLDNVFVKTIFLKLIKVKFRMPVYFICGYDEETDIDMPSQISYFDIEGDEYLFVGRDSSFIQDKTKPCHIFIPKNDLVDSTFIEVDSFKIGEDNWISLNQNSKDATIDVVKADGTLAKKFSTAFFDENGATILLNDNWMHYVILKNENSLGIRQISLKIKLNKD